MCMKKFFTSGKFGIKNKKFASVLDALLGWSFFVVSCCVAFFVYFFASDSNDVVYADNGDTSNPSITIVGNVEGDSQPTVFSEVLYNDKKYEGNVYYPKNGDYFNVKFTLKPGYILDRNSEGYFKIEFMYISPSGIQPFLLSYVDLTDSDEASNLHSCRTIQFQTGGLTQSAQIMVYLSYDKYPVKFSSNEPKFNDNEVIKDGIVDMDFSGKSNMEIKNGKTYFKYAKSKTFAGSITPREGYKFTEKGVSMSLSNIGKSINCDENGNFSFDFDDTDIRAYKNDDIKIQIKGIEKKGTIKIETDKEENKSVPYFDVAGVTSGGNITFDSGDDIYSVILPDVRNSVRLTIQSKPGYVFEFDENGNKKKVNIKTFLEENRINGNWSDYENFEVNKVNADKKHSLQTITLEIEVEGDTVIRINDIMFDEFEVRFMSDDEAYNENGFLQMYKKDTGSGTETGCVEIIRDAEGVGLTQEGLKALSVKFETPTHFKITPKGKYSMSNLSVCINDEGMPLCTGHTNYEGYYELKLDSTNIDEFYDEQSGYVNIVVKGICSNYVEIKFSVSDPSMSFWKKVSSINCVGSEDPGEYQSSPVDQWGNLVGIRSFLFENIQVGKDKTAIIKIKLDQWYKFKNNEDYKDLISIGDASEADILSKDLEKRKENTNSSEGYKKWYEEHELKDVAVFKIKISDNISTQRLVNVSLNNLKDDNNNDTDITEGYGGCSIEFTNEEDLIFKKVSIGQDGKFNSSDNPSKKFSEIKFGEPNYFMVETDGFKHSLEEKLRVDGDPVEYYFLNDAVIDGGSVDIKNKRIFCIAVNDNSDNYYPELTTKVKLGGVVYNDRFVIIEGVNVETIKESDITESKKFERDVEFNGTNKLSKITTSYNAPLSFVVRPSSEYSFPNIDNSNIENILKIQKIVKNNEGSIVIEDDTYNWVNDYKDKGKIVLENLGNSLEIRISNMSEYIYMVINSTPDKVPINFKQSEGIDYFKVNEGKLGDPLRGTITVDKGNNEDDKNKEYKFAVKVSDGYDPQSLKVLSNSAELGNSDTLEQEGVTYYIYTLSNIDKYTTVTASVEKLKCKLTFKKPPIGAYYTKVGSDTEITEQFTEDGILYGSNFSFRVKLKDEYSQSKLTVRAGDSEIQPLSDDTYTIYNITEDKTISIDDNVKINNYTVNFESSDRVEYILEGNGGKIKNIEHGGSCKFKVKAKTGYKPSENIAVNCVGASGSESLTGKKVSGSGSDAVYEYEIGNITENKTVSVSGIEDLFYNIKLQDVEGVTYINDTGSVISGTHKIAYGKNFEFSVNVDDAYDDSIPGMFIIVNEGRSMGVSAQKLSSGKYVIPNITQDITVRVGNIRKNRYTVTFTKTEGIDYYDTNGKIITGDTEVEQNDSISFKVSLYPAYSDSKITVMLGDKAVTADSSGVYTLTGIDENKTVTVLGVEKSKEADLINTINSLPNPVKTIDDVNLVVEASKIYNSLSDEKKKTITNYDLLQKLQEQVKAFHHISNDVKIEGVDWYLKLVAVPISSSTEICSRIYEKLNSEYILSLYDIYLWDTLNDKRYTLPSGTTAVISIPTPDMTYFNKPTGIHENDDGKIDYLSLTFDGGRTTFEAVTFSPFGVIANRSSTPGRSSLLDAVDANVDLIKDFALSSFGGDSSDKSGISGSAVFDDKNSNSDLLIGSEDDIEGNISEKYKSRNNKVTARGSALRLILVLMIIVLIALALWILYKRRKEMKKSKNNKNS